MKQLTEADMIEYVGLRDDGYFRFRLIQVLDKLAVAHGCDDEGCDCDCGNEQQLCNHHVNADTLTELCPACNFEDRCPHYAAARSIYER